MKLRGGEFSTGTTGIFQPELTAAAAPSKMPSMISMMTGNRGVP